MALEKEFKSFAQESIDQFIEQFTVTSNELIYTEQGILSKHPQDFNLGYALGFLEGTISTAFTNRYGKQMTQKENFEIRNMIGEIVTEVKQLIFDAEHR